MKSNRQYAKPQQQVFFDEVPIGQTVDLYLDENNPIIPDGFELADGHTVNDTDSPLLGSTLPNFVSFKQINTNYTMSYSDARLFSVTTLDTDLTFTLYNAINVDKQEVVIVKADSGTGSVIITPSIGDTIEGKSSFVLNDQFEKVILIPSGSNSWVVSHNLNIKNVPSNYHIYGNGLTATNLVETNGFATTLYTGNGTTQDVVTNVDMDTQWGDSADERFGGLVWIKNRDALISNVLQDSIRGPEKYIFSNAPDTESTLFGEGVTSFNIDGFSVQRTSSDPWNTDTINYVAWTWQTTHRTTGTTNHGKPYTCHYNPFTGFTIVKYEGSGIAGHEIPHHLERKVDLFYIKQLNGVVPWLVGGTYNTDMELNDTAADTSTLYADSENIYSVNVQVDALNNESNANAEEHILYGWADSFYDEKNTLRGNYEVGIYNGIGVAGNFVETRDKPAYLMVKRIDTADNWVLKDNMRGSGYTLLADLSNAEFQPTNTIVLFNGSSFSLGDASSATNASGGRYLYFVIYDNDAGSGLSTYDRATDTTTLQLDAHVPYANGLDESGLKTTIDYKNETVTLSNSLAEGKNYIASLEDGSYVAKYSEPFYGKTKNIRDREYTGEFFDVFDIETNKWYQTTDGGIELVTNGTFDIDVSGWIDEGTGLSYESGQAKYIYNADLGFYQDITVAAGTLYSIKFTINDINNLSNAVVRFSLVENGATVFFHDYENSQEGTYLHTYMPTGSSLRIKFTITGNVSAIAYIDNVSAFETVPQIDIEIPSRNYLDAVVYADAGGQPTQVVEQPKTMYFDEVKADEYKGKNACTAWVNFDGTTTPPIVYGSYNVSSVIRKTTGQWDIYFEDPMINENYNVIATGGVDANYNVGLRDTTGGRGALKKQLVSIESYSDASNVHGNINYLMITVFGGRE